MYRVFALNGMIGAGFTNDAAFEDALQNYTFDLVANDAGSMDFGPAYLGSGKPFFDDADCRSDLRYLVRLALDSNCPLVVGSAGTSGGGPHVQKTLELLADVLRELDVPPLRVAVIDAQIDAEQLAQRPDRLRPLGHIADATCERIRESTIVAQFGCGPIMAALAAGADIVIGGRACDVSVFAADMITHGVAPGIAHHVGHVLECGGIALSPSSALDCIIAEVDDDVATFISPDPARISTIQSVAAHGLYEESHVALQIYPEGVLTLEPTEYLQQTAAVAGLRGSEFVSQPLTVKVEGARPVGHRVCSFVACDPATPRGEGCFVYGVDGVEQWPVGPGEREVGVRLTVSGLDAEQVRSVLTLMKMGFLHYGYPHRITTSGNVAFPFSPTSFEAVDGDTTTEVSVFGSREPLFIEQLDEIEAALRARTQQATPDGYAACEIHVDAFDNDHPLAVVDTVADTPEEAEAAHLRELEQLGAHLSADDARAVRALHAGQTHEWSLFHQLTDAEFIAENLFPIVMMSWGSDGWEKVGDVAPTFPSFGLPDDGRFDLDEETLLAVEPVEHDRPPEVYRPLLDMCSVIRSKDAGATTLAYDMFFKTAEDYEAALRSGLFDVASMAERFGDTTDDWVACSRADACHAIKLARHRTLISGSIGSRDTYGSQQHLPIEAIQVPIY